MYDFLSIPVVSFFYIFRGFLTDGVTSYSIPPLTPVCVCDTGSEPVFVNLLRSPGIDSQPGGPVRQPYL